MKRKLYVTPKLEVLEIKSPLLMLTVSSEKEEAGTGHGSVGNETPDLAPTRRGTWGNLWA